MECWTRKTTRSTRALSHQDPFLMRHGSQPTANRPPHLVASYDTQGGAEDVFYPDVPTGMGPFVTAVIRLQKFIFDRGIDIFKTALSVPGIARQMLFDTARKQGAEFFLFDEKNNDLFHTVKTNIVGGPSIIYHRKAVKGETKISGGKVCKKVLGYDCNTLYRWCIG